jgi:predicted kinase
MAKIVPNKPLLIMLYGYPGAGKTYLARQLSESLQAAHVHGDRIRFELFEKPHYDKQEDEVVSQLMNYMTGEFLKAGLSVVYDGSVSRATQRRILRDMARQADAEPILVWQQIDLESAFTRSSKRDRRKVDDKYAMSMDRAMFENISGAMQNPAANEDYVVISGKHIYDTQRSAIMKRLRELGLISATEASSNVIKPGLVNLVPNPLGGRVDMGRRNIVIR